MTTGNYWDAASMFPYKTWCDKLNQCNGEDNYANAYVIIVEKLMSGVLPDYQTAQAICNLAVKRHFNSNIEVPVGINVETLISDARSNSETEIFYDEIIDFIFRKSYYWGQGETKDSLMVIFKAKAPSNKLTRYIIVNDLPLTPRMFTVVMHASGYSYSEIARLLGVSVELVRLYERKAFRLIYRIMPKEMKEVIKLL